MREVIPLGINSYVFAGQGEETKQIRDMLLLYRRLSTKKGKEAIEEISKLSEDKEISDLVKRLESEENVYLSSYEHRLGANINYAYIVGYGNGAGKELEAEKERRKFFFTNNKTRVYSVLIKDLQNIDKYNTEKKYKSMTHSILKGMKESFRLVSKSDGTKKEIPQKIYFVLGYDTSKEEFIFGKLERDGKKKKLVRVKESDYPTFMCGISPKNDLVVVDSKLIPIRYVPNEYGSIPRDIRKNDYAIWELLFYHFGRVNEYELQEKEEKKKREEMSWRHHHKKEKKKEILKRFHNPKK